MAVPALSIQGVSSNSETSDSSFVVQFSFSKGNYISSGDKFTGFLPLGSKPFDVPSS